MEKASHPDQNMQGLDIAYKLAFGDQMNYAVTWEWLDLYCLRNLLYPVILSIPMKILRMLDLDYNFAVVIAPMAMNALLQATGDYFSFALAERLLGKKCACIFAAYNLFNKEVFKICGKPLTNGAEVVFCMMAFYYFSKLKYKNNVLIFEKNMILMTTGITIAFLIRSSSIVGFVPLALWAIISSNSPLFNTVSIIQAGFTVAIPIVLISISIDSWYYGKLTWTQFNFLYVNVVDNVSIHYGTEAADFYVRALEIYHEGFNRYSFSVLGFAMICVF